MITYLRHKMIPVTNYTMSVKTLGLETEKLLKIVYIPIHPTHSGLLEIRPLLLKEKPSSP
jgi:hypothetical protein